MTIEKIEAFWDAFLKRADQAEQSQFVNTHMLHDILEPLYNDLHRNWNEHHANMFIGFIKSSYKKLGWNVEEVEEIG